MVRASMRRAFRRRWMRLATLVPVGALLAVFVTAGPASAAIPFPTAPGSVSNVYAYMCLDNEGNIVANYNPVDIYWCLGQPNQVWSYNTSDESLRLSLTPWMCLDVYAGGTWNGDSIDIYQCNGTGAQKWVPGPYFGSVENPQSGKCLDDPNFSLRLGTRLVLWDCNGGENQQWSFQYVS